MFAVQDQASITTNIGSNVTNLDQEDQEDGVGADLVIFTELDTYRADTSVSDNFRVDTANAFASGDPLVRLEDFSKFSKPAKGSREVARGKVNCPGSCRHSVDELIQFSLQPSAIQKFPFKLLF